MAMGIRVCVLGNSVRSVDAVLINQMSHPALPPVTRQLNMAQMASIYSAMMVGLPEKNIPALVSLILMCIVAGIAVLLAKFHFRSSLTGRSLSMLSLLYALFGFPVMSMATGTPWRSV